jgi:hypothetical protein
MSSSLTDIYSDGEPAKSVLQMSCLTDEWRSHHSGTVAEGALSFYVSIDAYRDADQPLLYRYSRNK